jgi:hypothetical protein
MANLAYSIWLKILVIQIAVHRGEWTQLLIVKHLETNLRSTRLSRIHPWQPRRTGASLVAFLREVAMPSIEGLIDEYQLVLNPIVLGNGRPLFGPLPKSVELHLLEAKPFKNGTVLLRYRPTPRG